MAQRSTLRASDEDRDRIADRLRRAAAEGRIHAHELEERLGRALRARTYGELDDVVRDLPVDRVARRSRPPAARWARPASLAIAIPLACVAVAIVLAAAVLVLSGVFAVWMVWVVVGWWMLGRRRGHHHRRRRHQHRSPSTVGLGGRRQFQRF